MFARQLDTEGGDTRILNEGSPLVILGLKTEGDCTVLDNRDGGRSSILGGLLYIVGDADPKVPAFHNTNAELEATFVEEAFSAAKRYTVYLRDHDRRRDVDAAPARGRVDGETGKLLFRLDFRSVLANALRGVCGAKFGENHGYTAQPDLLSAPVGSNTSRFAADSDLLREAHSDKVDSALKRVCTVIYCAS